MNRKAAAKATSISWGNDFYKLSRWRTLRERALQLYGTKCHCCGNLNEEQSPEVDHIKPRSLFPELSLSMTNLQVLCKYCNSKKGNHHSIDYRPLAHKNYAKRYALDPTRLNQMHEERLLVEHIGQRDANKLLKEKNAKRKLRRHKTKKTKKNTKKLEAKERKIQISFVQEMRESNKNGTVMTTVQKFENKYGKERTKRLVNQCNMNHWLTKI